MTQTQTTLTDEIKDYIEKLIAAEIKNQLKKGQAYATASIPGTAVRQRELTITGEQLQGGIVAGFSSTGIDDRATNCIVTIMDDVTVFENNLLAKDLTVKGNLIVEGTVSEDTEFYNQLTSTLVTKIEESLRNDLFKGLAATISTEGLDLKRFTVDGKAVIDGKMLGFGITESFLQKVGELRELQVAGETYLHHTMYVTKGRVGINTIDPSAALTVWDQDVEVNVSRAREGVARIGTPRAQSVILSSNNKQNIVLDTNGGVKIDDLNVGGTKIGSSNQPPAFASEKGHIVFNTNPALGGPVGWVCLGAAKWANFGILD